MIPTLLRKLRDLKESVLTFLTHSHKVRLPHFKQSGILKTDRESLGATKSRILKIPDNADYLSSIGIIKIEDEFYYLHITLYKTLTENQEVELREALGQSHFKLFEGQELFLQ